MRCDGHGKQGGFGSRQHGPTLSVTIACLQDEDGYLAYFCKAGDGVVDVQLIADLHKSEVFKVGAALGVPQATLQAAPSADLWDGQTDEDELGFTYDFIELYTGAYLPLDGAAQKAFTSSLGKAAKKQFGEWAAACTKVHNGNKHKFDSPKNLNLITIPDMRKQQGGPAKKKQRTK